MSTKLQTCCVLLSNGAKRTAQVHARQRLKCANSLLRILLAVLVFYLPPPLLRGEVRVESLMGVRSTSSLRSTEADAEVF